MLLALYTALGVGGATVVGAALGFLIKKIPQKYNDAILSFAAGVMLAAAIVGLILPSMELGGRHAALQTAAGIMLGAVFLSFADRFVPHLHRLVGIDHDGHSSDYLGDKNINSILLFVFAIALHNLPEGIAAGVAAGQGDASASLSVTIGIMLQNIPEGMVIVPPLLAAGASRGRAFCLAALTGFIEVIGTAIGYFTVSLSSAILPFALAFAGGTMLYVIVDEMIPETHGKGFERLVTFSLLSGFVLMLAMDFYL